VAWAERRVPSGLAALLVAVVPLWMVLLDWVRPGGARPRAAVVAGVIAGLAGLAVLVGRDSLTGHGGVDALGAGVLVAASMSWAIGSVYNRHGARPDSAAMSTALQMLGGSVWLLALGLAFGETSGIHMASITLASWLGWIYLVTFGALIGFTAYIYLLRHVSAAKASTYAYVNPIVAVILGWAVAGESVTPRTVLAAAIILGGVDDHHRPRPARYGSRRIADCWRGSVCRLITRTAIMPWSARSMTCMRGSPGSRIAHPSENGTGARSSASMRSRSPTSFVESASRPRSRMTNSSPPMRTTASSART
jgi:threonine/homoserine efflux transporter RhtA